jgi:hypothetical protein
MKTDAKLRDVLYSVLPEECEIVGPTVVEQLAEGVQFVPAEGGSYIDIERAIATIAAAIKIAEFLWKAIPELKQGLKQPTVDELRQKVQKANLTGEQINGQQVTRICESVLKDTADEATEQATREHG